MELTKADEGVEEAQQDRSTPRRCDDGADGGVARDGNAAHGFAVGGVGAAAEEGAHDGADAVAEQGAVKAGIGDAGRGR